MDSDSTPIRIEQLNYSNYHAWKIRIVHILTLKGLDEYITDYPPTDPESLPTWKKLDRRAQATIGLTLSNDMLENVRDIATAKDMWIAIKNVFERHTLLNKLSARRKFYTANMTENETIIKFSNRIRQLASTLKNMNVDVSESEMAMALLNGLPDAYHPLISALDSIDSDGHELSWEHVKSRVLQEEQRISTRNKDAQAKSEAAALVSNADPPSSCTNCQNCQGKPIRQRPYCTHCKKKGHTEPTCWEKYPQLNPRKKKNTAIIAAQGEEDPSVCLMAKYEDSDFPRNSGDWFVDSACSIHMTYDKSLFSSYSPGDHSPVRLGNKTTANVAGSGNVTLLIKVNGRNRKCYLKNVLHVPQLGYQLLSIPTLDKSGKASLFESGRVFIQSRDVLLATGTLQGNLYRLDTLQPEPNSAFLSVEMETWHRRLAHLSPATISEMAARNLVHGLNLKKGSPNLGHCEGCILGKGHRSPIPKVSSSKSTKLLQLVHSDVNGPIETPSLGGSRYFVTFIDDYSKWTVLYTMQRKSDTFDCFKRYHAYAEKHTGATISSVNVIKRVDKTKAQIKALRTDNGGEYISLKFKDYLEKHGIQHQLTVAYTPQQNGVAERMNRTLMDCARSMLHSANLEEQFWAEALATAVHIRNRVLSRSLPSNQTPFHRWMGKPPDFSYLRVFGSRCFYVTPKTKKKKLDARARPGIMLGYPSQSKGYKIWDVDSKKMIVSRDVQFLEHTHENTDAEVNPDNVSVQGGEVKLKVEQNIVPPNIDSENDSHDTDHPEEDSETTSDEEFEDATDSPAPVLRRSTRVRKQTGEWWKNTTMLAHALAAEVVPSSFKVATAPENITFWNPGIESEHASLLKCQTWKLIDYKKGMKVLPSKYVFKIKENKPKVRLVALGCRQVSGIDYNETYAPVVTMTTIRSVLAIVACNNLELEQMDVKTAFLNGDLEEDVFMAVPEGLRSKWTENKVCKLQKSIYGLKQSPRQWYAKMHEFLLNLKFASSRNDPCLYVRHLSSKILIIALYVDDLLIAGNSMLEIKSLKAELSRRFEMKDMGAASVMLGIKISRERASRKLFISQHDYAITVLERFGMETSKPVSTPMDKTFLDLVTVQSDPIDSVRYRQAIGSLMYLMIGSRPDLAFAIGKLSQHCENPNENHWIAVKRLLRYVKGTTTFGILYDGSNSSTIKGFSDADWAGCKLTRKSTSGLIFIIAGGAVCWKSKKQTCVATSTCEAEYIALCLATKEAIWLSRLVADIKQSSAPEIIGIGVDNDGAIDTGKNSSVNQRNKHIDIQYHFVRDSVQSNLVRLLQVNTEEQLADPFTKPLDRVSFEKLRSGQGLCATPF